MTTNIATRMASGLLLGLVLASATTAGAVGPEAAYQALWAKHAINALDPTTWTKPKATCVCHSGMTGDEQVGAFAISPEPGFTLGSCAVPTFDSNGNIATMVLCYTFDYVGK